MELDEQEVYDEFEKALLEAIAIYESVKNITYPQLNIFIEDKVWDSLIKYNRMQLTTKEKFFENLYKQTPLEEYAKGVYDMWENIDHSYMNKSIKELQKMVIQKDFKNAEMYGNKKITKRSIKLENIWEDFKQTQKELYPIHPARDFSTIERRYANRHVKLYKNMLKRFSNSKNLEEDLAKLVERYDKIDKSVPYFSHSTGNIQRWVDVGTYNSMLENVNLTRSAWNRAIYDAMLLDNNLFYLPAHPYACHMCAEYQGYVYAKEQPTTRETYTLQKYGKPGIPFMYQAIEGGVGHPNCKHDWVSYWSQVQIQDEKYNSEQWDEKYDTKQKIQSLDLKKSRLLADRRIYKNLGQQDLVDKVTTQIKSLREKIKELETQL